MTFRILITGSRTWDNTAVIAKAMADAIVDAGASQDETIIVHGACPRGADNIADILAQSWEANIETHAADWDTHGKAAGFIRNAEMVNLGADICLAFIKDNSKGASHTLDLATRAGIPVQVFRE